MLRSLILPIISAWADDDAGTLVPLVVQMSVDLLEVPPKLGETCATDCTSLMKKALGDTLICTGEFCKDDAPTTLISIF